MRKGVDIYYENMMGMHAVWWVFLIGLVIALLIWGGGSSSGRRDKLRETPHEALRRRLASGEISSGEYEKRKTLLDRDS